MRKISSKSAQERATERAALKRHRQTARDKIALLRQKLREALAARKARMKELQAQCRAQRRELRDKLQAMRLRMQADLRERLRKEREEMRRLCTEQKQEARRQTQSAVVTARALLAAERQRQAEERRIAREHSKRLAAGENELAQKAHSDAVLRVALLGQFGPLFERVRPTLKPAPGQSHAEAFLKYGEKHPEELHAATEPAAERTIAKLKGDIAETERSMRSPSRDEIERATRRVRRAANDATPSPFPPDFAAALERYMQRAQAGLDRTRERLNPGGIRDVLSIEPGKRYVRIVRSTTDGRHRSAYGFVDRTNGNLLKSASWKKPVTKVPWGNIFAPGSVDESISSSVSFLR